MKSLFAVLVAIPLTGCVGLSPHSDATSITDFEIGMYKSGMKKGCTDQGIGKGGDPTEVKAFCECVLNVYSQSLTREDWQVATYSAQNKLDRDEAKVFAPYFVQVRGCKNGA
jgi:hypothetical protein